MLTRFIFVFGKAHLARHVVRASILFPNEKRVFGSFASSTFAITGKDVEKQRFVAVCERPI